MDIHLLPILDDNYAYILRDEDQDYTAVIDPGEAAPILGFLKDKGWRLNLIVNTHHHGDHVGGNADLMQEYNCPLAGPKAEMDKIDNITIPLDESVKDFKIAGNDIKIIETAGHTAGHICLYSENLRALFAGDTLFSLGCGRLFEGTAKDMLESIKKLKNLPDETRLYCGHEYTLNNGRFAQSLDPENEALQMRMMMVEALRSRERPTLPVTLGLEKQTNPFMQADSVKQFALYRKMKDNFVA